MGTTAKRRVAAVCAGGIALAATNHWAGDDGPDDGHGVYEDFAKSGVFDPGMSNIQANELVSKGLFGGDPRVVRLVLEALASHSDGRRFGEVVGRDFHKVPRLKEFLIAHWRKRILEGDLNRSIEDMGDFLDRNPITDEIADEPHAMFVWGTANAADWVLIPPILAAAFPGDEDVHDLLWEYDSLSQDVPSDGWILEFFNQGRFKTPEVDRLRIDSVGNEDRFTAVLAAEGIAFSKPEGGLEALDVRPAQIPGPGGHPGARHRRVRTRGDPASRRGGVGTHQREDTDDRNRAVAPWGGSRSAP